MSFSIQPSRQVLEKARSKVDVVMQSCEAVLPKDENFEVLLGCSDRFESQALDETAIAVRFNPSDDWEEALEEVAARGYAESWMEEYKDPVFHWEQVLVLGHALKFAEKITGNTPELDDFETLEDNWLDIRDELGEHKTVESDILSAYGFSLAYMIADELLENHGFEDFPEMTMSDVIDAGDKLFA
ncbi:MAG: hypothetical protein ABEJ72_00705 [Candidatus Aenigmatarchaeota archaeon]